MAVDANQLQNDFNTAMSLGQWDKAASYAKQAIDNKIYTADQISGYVGSNPTWGVSGDQASGFLNSYMNESAKQSATPQSGTFVPPQFVAPTVQQPNYTPPVTQQQPTSTPPATQQQSTNTPPVTPTTPPVAPSTTQQQAPNTPTLSPDQQIVTGYLNANDYTNAAKFLRDKGYSDSAIPGWISSLPVFTQDQATRDLVSKNTSTWLAQNPVKPTTPPVPQPMHNSKYLATDPHVLAGKALVDAALGGQFGNITDADTLIAAYNKRKAQGQVPTGELQHWKMAANLFGIDTSNVPELKDLPLAVGNGQPGNPYTIALQALAKAGNMPDVTDRSSLIAAYDKRMKNGTPMTDAEAENWKLAAYLAGIDTTGFDFKNNQYNKTVAAAQPPGTTAADSSTTSFVDPNKVPLYDGRQQVATQQLGGKLSNPGYAPNAGETSLITEYLTQGNLDKATQYLRGNGMSDQAIVQFVSSLSAWPDQKTKDLVSLNTARYLAQNPVPEGDKPLITEMLQKGQLDQATKYLRSKGMSDDAIIQWVTSLPAFTQDQATRDLVSLNTARYLSQNPAPNQGTVQDRLTGLLDQNGKYVQQARNNAMMTANDRGLLNSTIAAGAGEKAAIESALPIAQQDAQAYNTQALANQQAANTAYGNEYQSKASLYNAQQNAATDALNKAEFQKRAFLNDSSLSAQSATQAKDLAGYQSQLDMQKQKQLADLNLTAAEKNAYLQKDINLQQAGFDILKINAQAASDYAKAQLQADVELQKAHISADTQIKVEQLNDQTRTAIQSMQNASEWAISESKNSVTLQGYNLDYKSKLMTGLSNILQSMTDANTKIMGQDTGVDWATKVHSSDVSTVNYINLMNQFLFDVNQSPTKIKPSDVSIGADRSYTGDSQALRPFTIHMDPTTGYYATTLADNTSKATGGTTTGNQQK